MKFVCLRGVVRRRGRGVIAYWVILYTYKPSLSPAQPPDWLVCTRFFWKREEDAGLGPRARGFGRTYCYSSVLLSRLSSTVV